MPARISIELDDNILQLAADELELSSVPSFTLNHSGRVPGIDEKLGKIRGSYDPKRNHITITAQGESYEKEGLYVLTKHIRFTALHELRHAHQQQHWTPEQLSRGKEGPYQFQPVEIDANKWAEYAMPKYVGLIRVKKQQVGRSGFAALSAHTNRRSA